MLKLKRVIFDFVLNNITYNNIPKFGINSQNINTIIYSKNISEGELYATNSERK